MTDNTGLNAALASGHPVLPVFIFDTEIIDELNNDDPRITFIYNQLEKVKFELTRRRSSLLVKKGTPMEVWMEIINEFNIQSVYTNRDYEPYAKVRDQSVGELLDSNGIDFYTYKDQVVLEADQVQKNDGSAYRVFTPYYKSWLKQVHQKGLLSKVNGLEREDAKGRGFLKCSFDLPPLEAIGFIRSSTTFPAVLVEDEVIKNYNKTKDIPALEGTTCMGIHLRFGTVSIRWHAARAMALNDVYLRQLVWREFYMMILDRFPHVVSLPFRPEYEHIEWLDDKNGFIRWCNGQTGYPLVDAGMRQLNTTGYMHNRLRMVTAGFLTKHLLIDWRWGENYFAQKLLDYELANNNGGWQWAAGCGTDAAPYFRIFNPMAQQKKFDPDFNYIKRFVPEWGTSSYPAPIIDHAEARRRCLQTFKKALNP